VFNKIIARTGRREVGEAFPWVWGRNR